MAIFRINKTKDYTVMSNAHLRDKRLSFKAKGILSVMLSLPEDWDYSIAGLETLASDGSTATRAALKELELSGYLIRHSVRENGKIVDWEYNVFENPEVEKPLVENQQVGNPQVGNRLQLNIKEENTYIIKDVEREDTSPLTDFCDKFNINIDGYNMRVHDMDFDRLSEAFTRSEWLRKNFVSLTKICREYDKIIGGYYQDFTTPQRGGQHTDNERHYTREELNALVTDIDDLDL